MKKLLPLFMASLIAAFLVPGCGSSKKEPGQPTPTGIAFVGVTTCFNCHSDQQNPSSFPPVFGDTQVAGVAWLQSRHANNTTGGEDSNSPSYDDFTGRTDPANPSTSPCARCHDPQGDGLHLQDLAQVGNPLGSNRPIVGCEACHGPGGDHWGIGPLPNDFDKAGVEFTVCSGCHELALTPSETPAFHDDPATIFDQFAGDTHVDNAATNVIEGYVLNPNGVHSDLVGNTNNGTCQDCHRPHGFENTINNQWVLSGHAGDLGNNPAGDSSDPPFIEDDFKSDEENRCQRCHTSTGFRNIANNQDAYDANHDTIPDTPNVFVATGEQRELIYCWACHYNNSGGIRPITTGGVPGVRFPSGQVADLVDPEDTGGSRTCMMCHQGRESGVSVQKSIDTGSTALAFLNVHYFAAAASYFGTETRGGYQYPGLTYAGRQENVFKELPHLDVEKVTCAGCHLRLGETDDTDRPPPDHNFVPRPADCAACHSEIEVGGEETGEPGGAFRALDPVGVDYDGDGSAEPLFNEIAGLEEDLIAEIMVYASTVIQKPIAFGDIYPYFVNDLNGNGIADPDELNRNNRYTTFDAKLLPAAYNLNVSKQEPCGYIHNHRYIVQLLIDSIRDLRADPSGAKDNYTRPNGINGD